MDKHTWIHFLKEVPLNLQSQEQKVSLLDNLLCWLCKFLIYYMVGYSITKSVSFYHQIGSHLGSVCIGHRALE